MHSVVSKPTGSTSINNYQWDNAVWKRLWRLDEPFRNSPVNDRTDILTNSRVYWLFEYTKKLVYLGYVHLKTLREKSLSFVVPIQSENSWVNIRIFCWKFQTMRCIEIIFHVDSEPGVSVQENPLFSLLLVNCTNEFFLGIWKKLIHVLFSEELLNGKARTW